MVHFVPKMKSGDHPEGRGSEEMLYHAAFMASKSRTSPGVPRIRDSAWSPGKSCWLRPAWDVEKRASEKVSWQPERCGEDPLHSQPAWTFQIFLWIKVQNEFLGQIPTLGAILSTCLEVPKLNPRSWAVFSITTPVLSPHFALLSSMDISVMTVLLFIEQH